MANEKTKHRFSAHGTAKALLVLCLSGQYGKIPNTGPSHMRTHLRFLKGSEVLRHSHYRKYSSTGFEHNCECENKTAQLHKIQVRCIKKRYTNSVKRSENVKTIFTILCIGVVGWNACFSLTLKPKGREKMSADDAQFWGSVYSPRKQQFDFR